jgi:dCMP deaminase
MSKVRPDWDTYFINLLDNLGDRCTCNRGKCACIFTLDNRILSTGYAGAPSGLQHCLDVGDQLEERVKILNIDFQGQTLNKDYIKYDWNNITKRYESKKKINCCRTSHSEANAICHAAKHGVSLNNSTLYVTMTPCADCCKLLISVGVKRIVCKKKYHAGAESEALFKEVGIEVKFMSEEIEQYTNQTV